MPVQTLGFDAASTMIRRVQWQGSEYGTLEILFNSGAIYKYANVSIDTYREFENAPSQGQFFNTRIKNNFAEARLV